MSRQIYKLNVNTGDEFWKIMDHLLCIRETYPGEARAEARVLCDMWEAKKAEIRNLEEAIEVLQTKDDYV